MKRFVVGTLIVLGASGCAIAEPPQAQAPAPTCEARYSELYALYQQTVNLYLREHEEKMNLERYAFQLDKDFAQEMLNQFVPEKQTTKTTPKK